MKGSRNEKAGSRSEGLSECKRVPISSKNPNKKKQPRQSLNPCSQRCVAHKIQYANHCTTGLFESLPYAMAIILDLVCKTPLPVCMLTLPFRPALPFRRELNPNLQERCFLHAPRNTTLAPLRAFRKESCLYLRHPKKNLCCTSGVQKQKQLCT